MAAESAAASALLARAWLGEEGGKAGTWQRATRERDLASRDAADYAFADDWLIPGQGGSRTFAIE